MAAVADNLDEFDGPEPDAISKGWVRPPGEEHSVEALFVLSGRLLGVGRVQRVTPPVWLDLDQLVNLDAIGEPSDEVQEVELSMEDHTVVGAGWPLPFCDAVVQALQKIHSSSGPAPAPAPAAEQPEAPEQPAAPAPEQPAAEATPSGAVDDSTSSATESEPPTATTPSAAPADASAVGAVTGTAGTLELEDVVYLGGFRGHAKKRKRCTVTMDQDSLRVVGPGPTDFAVMWSDVRTIEVQNSDEARFRMNIKIHRDASALVVESNDDSVVVLEARECPTIPLRAAITELLSDSPVRVR